MRQVAVERPLPAVGCQPFLRFECGNLSLGMDARISPAGAGESH